MSATAISDSHAIALICAPLRVGDAKPLSNAEWAQIATAIHRSVGHPGQLIGMSTGDLASALSVDGTLAERLVHLLARGGPFAFELDRLASRGIWLLTRADDDYPIRLKQRLGLRAPAVLFGSGSRELFSMRGVAVVGSRDSSEAALELAARIGESLAREEIVVVSGGARGIDRASMSAAMNAGGSAIGFIADSLVRFGQQADTRERLMDGHLALVTPFAPDARFTVGNAMTRNKLVYCAADAGIVIATTAGSGGTWAGATEAIKARWVPVWAWIGSSAPDANGALVEVGAQPLRERDVESGALFDVLTATAAGGNHVVDSGSEFPDIRSPEVRTFLVVPRSEVELRDEFNLKLGQVRLWMRDSVESGDVTRREQPVRYVIRDAEPSLFDAH